MFKRLYPPSPITGPIDIKIELVSGFELFNSKPYHNYETWSNGWKISTGTGKLLASAESLEDAIMEFYIQYAKSCPDICLMLTMFRAEMTVRSHLNSNTESFNQDLRYYLVESIPVELLNDIAMADAVYWNTHKRVYREFGCELIPIKWKYNNWNIGEKMVLDAAKNVSRPKVIIIDDILGSDRSAKITYRKFNY